MTTIVEVKHSPVHGKGVFATRNIKKGEVIVESHMALVHVNENLPEALATLQFPWTDEYDAICLSDVGSFFNHNCEPSAEIINRDFNNLVQTFAAKTDIIKGDEITIYYNDAFEKFIKE
ncbi:SET domain-containing protein [Aquaticitalea lipolytica]|uniref:SET domain-containing protein n=1 Tax=Aquaticitalea lipolytica TaxID=1247562 RepID=UPI0024B880B7|nr:SET domain-containing protein-lysine N-methyltransferase [Aquaticitalea lipolytica]